MAQMEIDFPEDMLNGLLDVDAEDLCKQMIDSAAPIMEESMKKEMRSVIQHSGDSELVDSVKTSKAKKAKNGEIIAFTGPKGNSKNYYYRNGKKGRRIQVSNVLKAIWLNYGRVGQPARPFLTKAVNNAYQKVMEKMQQTYDQLTGGRHGSE